ncbi:MAG: hypothetical protein DWH91_18240 [Planctomycetota bacterium]|nr:MAG: hypothetical protein DWH91_18240 [Planctomycetota bacterium]
MKTPGHDEQLSAFHDGELSAAERMEVERRLTESETLRGELHAITQLSTRLNDLADAVPEFSLVDRVMSQLPPSTAAASTAGLPETRQRRMRLGAWLWTVAGLGLAALLTWPLMSVPNQVGSLPAVPSPHLAIDSRHTEASPSALAVASDQPVMAMNDTFPPVSAAHDVPGSPVPAMAPADPRAVAGAMEPAGVAVTEESADPQELQQLTRTVTRIIRDRSLTNGEQLTLLESDGPVPVLLDYQVVDVARVANSIQVLLHKNGVQSLTPGGTVTADTVAKNHLSEDEMRVIYVAATPQVMNSTFEASNEDVLSNNLGEVYAINVTSDRGPDPANIVVNKEPAGPPEKPAGESLAGPAQSAAALRISKVAEATAPPAPSITLPSPPMLNGICVELNDGQQFYAELSQRQSGAYNQVTPRRTNQAGRGAPVPAVRNAIEGLAGGSANTPFTPEQLQNSYQGGQRKLQKALIVVRSRAAVADEAGPTKAQAPPRPATEPK